MYKKIFETKLSTVAHFKMDILLSRLKNILCRNYADLQIKEYQMNVVNLVQQPVDQTTSSNAQ